MRWLRALFGFDAPSRDFRNEYEAMRAAVIVFEECSEATAAVFTGRGEHDFAASILAAVEQSRSLRARVEKAVTS